MRCIEYSLSWYHLRSVFNYKMPVHRTLFDCCRKLCLSGEKWSKRHLYDYCKRQLLVLTVGLLTSCIHWQHAASVREYVFFVFFRFQKTWLCTFFEVTYQKVVKSHQKKLSSIRHQGVITSLNDHCNSIPSSQEPLLNIWLIGSIGRNKITNATKAAVVGLPGSKRREGTLGSVRFWQQ